MPAPSDHGIGGIHPAHRAHAVPEHADIAALPDGYRRTLLFTTIMRERDVVTDDDSAASRFVHRYLFTKER